MGLRLRSFNFVYWTMLLFLVGDTLDTAYRFMGGYLGVGPSFPGVNFIIQPTSVDLFFFIFAQLGVVYGIYLLYKLKRVGGYWFLGSQIFFLLYASVFGPISKIGISSILFPLILFFCVYIILVVFVPLYYSDKFK